MAKVQTKKQVGRQQVAKAGLTFTSRRSTQINGTHTPRHNNLYHNSNSFY